MWQAMSEVWRLPMVDEIQNTGKEWLLHLACNLPVAERAMLLMTLWRIWHVRNELVHDKQAPSIEASRRFLVSYLDSLLAIAHHPEDASAKGKCGVDYGSSRVCVAIVSPYPETIKLAWKPPPAGWCKLNVDGSYDMASGTGGAGIWCSVTPQEV